MFLSEIMVNKKIIKEKINLIISPTGTGKTTYFFEHLIKEYKNKRRIVYLVDTNMLEESMLQEHQKYAILYEKKWEEDLVLGEEGFGFLSNKENKVVVMSYHRFGFLLQKNPEVLNYLDLVVIDEAHNLLKYSKIDISKLKKEYKSAIDDNIQKASQLLNGCTYLAYSIPKFLKEYNIDWIFMTATPNKILKHKEYNEIIYDVLQAYCLQGYKTHNTITFENVRNVLKEIKKGSKILIYTQTIKQCKLIKEQLTEKGFNCIALWSKNNKDYKMSLEQLEDRMYIIKNKKIPIDKEILIINDAYETGWNLEDEQVKIVICNTSQMDTITQIRGRVRHDVDLLMHRGKTTKRAIVVPNDFIGIELLKEDIIRLEEYFDLYDSKGRNIKWKKIKQIVIATGKYEITTKQKKINNKKYTINIIKRY